MPKKSICLAFLMCMLAGPALFARVWTDRQGQTIDAQFIRLRGESVVLQKGLKPLVIPFSEFCDKDQEYIREQTKNKGGAKPPAVPKSDDESAEAKKSKTTDDANPFTPDDEKKPDASARTEEKKPKGEDATAPEINTEGGFDERTWTDIKGNKLTANFSRIENKMVILLKNGQEQRYQLDRFSPNDKKYIQLAMLELQKYQKFTGNRTPTSQQDGMQAQGAPPQVARSPSRPPGMGAGMPPSSSPFDAMHQMMAQQQADAARRQQEALAQEQERARQAEIARQQRDERERQRMEQQQQLAEVRRQNAEQQRIAREQQFPNTPAFTNSPQPQMVGTKYCMKCNKPVADNSKAGDTCPYCGVTWDMEQDERGKVVAYSPWFGVKSIIGIIVFGVSILVGVARRLSRS
jgi:hypothetical protein